LAEKGCAPLMYTMSLTISSKQASKQARQANIKDLKMRSLTLHRPIYTIYM